MGSPLVYLEESFCALSLIFSGIKASTSVLGLCLLPLSWIVEGGKL